MYDAALGNTTVQRIIREEPPSSINHCVDLSLIEPPSAELLARYGASCETERTARILGYLDPIIRPQNSNLGVEDYLDRKGNRGLFIYPRDSEFVDHENNPVVRLGITRLPQGIKAKLGGRKTIDLSFNLKGEKQSLTVRVNLTQISNR
jgi:hypothetical protein